MTEKLKITLKVRDEFNKGFYTADRFFNATLFNISNAGDLFIYKDSTESYPFLAIAHGEWLWCERVEVEEMTNEKFDKVLNSWQEGTK